MTEPSTIEWVWFVTAGSGWVVKLFLLASARANYRHHRRGTQLQVFMAKSVYYHMAHMMAVFSLCLAAAGWAVTHPPPPPPLAETQSFAIAVFFLSVTVVLTAHALQVSRWWNKLEDGYYNGDTRHVTTVETTIPSGSPKPHVQVTQMEQPGTGKDS